MDQAPYEAPTLPVTEAAAITPMMGQFLEIKAANPAFLLFYRMGDFYEMFFEDAEIASAALGIVLTKRGKHQGRDIPMCGVPVHAAQDYLKKLIGLGHRVAICEQVEDPAEAKKRGGKSPVKRDVVRLVTRGTITEDDLLPARGSNFLAALGMTRHGEADFALAWADVSTGEVWVIETGLEALADELARIEPAELILTEAVRMVLADARLVLPGAIQPVDAALFDSEAAAERIAEAFGGEVDPTAFARAGRSALGALIAYVRETQKSAPLALRLPAADEVSAHMRIDAATRSSLELLVTQRGERKGSLLSEIDLCVTPAGSRLLSSRLAAPLSDPGAINARLDAVETLRGDTLLTGRLRATLKSVPDLTRAMTRLALDRGGPRDLLAVAYAVRGSRGVVRAARARSKRRHRSSGSSAASSLPRRRRWPAELIRAVDESPPLLARDGGFTRAWL